MARLTVRTKWLEFCWNPLKKFSFRFTEGLPIIRAGEEYYVMPLRLQNLLRDNLLRLGFSKDEMEKKLSNYFALCRTDQLRMALVKRFEWNLVGIL